MFWKVMQVLRYAKEIRIGVQSSKAHGHASAGVSCLDRIIDLGFEGRIVVVYEDGCAAKLVDLLKGFNPEAEGQTLTYRGNKVALYSLSLFGSSEGWGPRQSDAVGIVAAADHHLEEWPQRLRTDVVLVLQPFDWGERHLVSEVLGFGANTVPMPGLPTYFLRQDWRTKVMPGKSPSALRNFLMSQRNERFDTLRAGGLEQVLRLQSQKQLLMLPIYGLHWYDAWKVDISPQSVLLNIVGASIALRQMLANHRVNPVPSIAICIFGETTATSQEAVEEIAKILGNPKVRRVSLKAVLSDTFDRPGIYVVECGFAPTDVFRYVMTQSLLPVFVEGANSVNDAHQLGMPYLSVRHLRTTDYPEVPGNITTTENQSFTTSKCRAWLDALSRALVRGPEGLALDELTVAALLKDVDPHRTVGTLRPKDFLQVMENLEEVAGDTEWGLLKTALSYVLFTFQNQEQTQKQEMALQYKDIPVGKFICGTILSAGQMASWYFLGDFLLQSVTGNGWVRPYFKKVTEFATNQVNDQVSRGLEYYHDALRFRSDVWYMQKVQQLIAEHELKELQRRLEELQRLLDQARAPRKPPLMLTYK
ncbi:hypothetical protein LZ198_25865 [Myxococcus sp. K15C18031901]|uniref:hypothetical protein n=1 Tax=Myxococcus dinghuensis TaxID=2906761 RepID=UPI0020A738BB|nr:hypothetical protein [Myxococcus dinghuensis]MCP3102302.1 hypothetical protein [Myxococcus dinghuensis]